MATDSSGAQKTYNMDLLSLHKKHLAIKKEIEHCQSSNFLDIKEFDLKRINAYIKDLKEKRDQIIAKPEQDLPEWTPHEYPIEPFGECAAIENELLADFIRYMQAMDYELMNSQSSRAATSIISHDLGRYDVSIKKLEDQLAYAATVKPLDRPESSPKAEMSAQGNVGV